MRVPVHSLFLPLGCEIGFGAIFLFDPIVTAIPAAGILEPMPPTDSEIARACETLLATAALDEITLRQVRVTLEQQFGTSISRLKVIEVIGAPHVDFSTVPGCCLRDKRPFLKETILRVYVENEGNT